LEHKRFPLQLSGNLANAAVEINGAIDDVLNLQGVDAEAQLTGKNFAALGPVLDIELPATDQFEIQGHLTGSSKALTRKNAQAAAILGSLHFTANGVVQDLLTLGGMDLQSRLSGKELAEIGPLFGTKLPGLGHFDMSGKLAGSAKAFSLNKFSAKVDKSDFAGLAKFEFRKRPKITIRLESSVIDFT